MPGDELTPEDREALRQLAAFSHSADMKKATIGILMQSGWSLEEAVSLCDDLYLCGWRDALLLFGMPDAEFPDGSKFWEEGQGPIPD